MKKPILNIIGKKYGTLLVIKEGDRKKYKSGATCRMVFCFCSRCKNTISVSLSNLTSGAVKGCGVCYRKTIGGRNKRHGLSHTPIYHSWADMMDRCYNPKNKRYSRYGGRGITVAEEWQIPDNFFHDMGEKPIGKTLDRIDNDKGYSKENCRWADKWTQAENRRTTRLLTIDGKTQSVSAWGREKGIKQQTLSVRVKKGWTNEELFIRKNGVYHIT